MIDAPIISIITVTFNAERTLPRTLESIHGQLGIPEGSIEHILIDGASTDATLSAAAPYRDRVAHLVSEPDSGIYDAMNKGLALASGDYIWFMNAGDEIHDARTVSKVLDLLRDNPDILYGETMIIDDEGSVIGPRRLKAPEHLDWRQFRQGMLVSHQAFIVRRAIAPIYDPRYRYSADVDWCIRCMKAAEHPIRNAYLVLANYLDEGITTRHRHLSHKERFSIMSHHYGLFPTAARHLWFAMRFAWAKLTTGRV